MSKLDKFHLDSDRGFLPFPDPTHRLPPAYDPWEETARNLPKLLVAQNLRSVIERLPLLATKRLSRDQELRRAMLILSFLGHAYVWGEEETVASLPAGLAVPWYEVSRRLGRPPILSYASYALDNWRRVDSKGPIDLGNIVLLQNFLGGLDEEWFILVHVAIEARAGAAVAAIVGAQEAVAADNPEALAGQLSLIAQALEAIYGILLRMPERCDPYIYYHRVRPYLHGWSHHPALPEGMVYEGVGACGGRAQKFRGETGAQSSIVPSLDAALGIAHKEGLLHTYLMEMRDYMPPAHRAFIEAVERGPSIRAYVFERRRSHSSLKDGYNACVQGLDRFRSTHLEYAHTYIQHQSQHGLHNPSEVGTGGTPFIPYLKKHRDETAEHIIE